MAYNAASVLNVDAPSQDGSEHIVVQFTGNAGEAAVQKDYTLDENSTIALLRQWVYGVLTALNGRKSNLSLVTKGANIPPLQPTDPVPTAQDLWLADARRLVRLKAIVDAGGLLASNAEYVALQTSVKNGYQAAYAGAI